MDSRARTTPFSGRVGDSRRHPATGSGGTPCNRAESPVKPSGIAGLEKKGPAGLTGGILRQASGRSGSHIQTARRITSPCSAGRGVVRYTCNDRGQRKIVCGIRPEFPQRLQRRASTVGTVERCFCQEHILATAAGDPPPAVARPMEQLHGNINKYDIVEANLDGLIEFALTASTRPNEESVWL